MKEISVRPTDDDIIKTVTEYSTSLYKIAFVILCDPYDAEDVVQDTFIKYITKSPRFSGESHKRAWLIKVAVNTAKNKKNYNSRHAHLDLDALEDFLICDELHEDSIDIPLLTKLPLKYRKALYLHYIEDLSVDEISKIERTTVFAVKHRLQRGKALLKKQNEVNKEVNKNENG